MRDDKSALLAGVTASDNVDGDVTAFLVVERVNLTDSDGSISVSYAAFDSAGTWQRPNGRAGIPITNAPGSR